MAVMLAGALALGACSTPLSMPFRGSSGFFAQDTVDQTGSIDGSVRSTSLPLLLGEKRWPSVRAAIQLSLAESADGDTVSWNELGTVGGSVTPMLSFANSDGASCRRLALRDNASDAGDLFFDACKQPTGVWLVEPAIATS
ncbi:MAG: hypothetical protein AB7L41_05090 [Flavobacteriaceae bacterium]